MRQLLIAAVLLLLTVPLSAAELVRIVRFKISAGDLLSAIAAAEDYRSTTGADPEYLDAIGWIARGAESLRRPDLAKQYVEQLHRDIPQETEATLIPYGASIEVEGRLIAASEGRGAAIRYFEQAFDHAQAASLKSRIRKNINLLSLEGQPALPIEGRDLRGKPTLLFFWAAGCGDCKAQGPALQRVWGRYKSRGLDMITVTRLYGGSHDKPQTPDEEKADIQKFWNDVYPDLKGVPVVISTDAMVRYGVSATPTFALVDQRGIVRLYTPTRLSEAELSRRIEDVLR
jgi:thiol-disulfide isomerase/thioredoxin